MDHIPSIGSVMTPFPYVVQIDESVLAARALMVEHQVRHLPVKDGDTLLGVLTDRDLKRALDPSLGLPPKAELFVRDVFVPDAYVVDVGEPLDGVLDHLSSQHMWPSRTAASPIAARSTGRNRVSHDRCGGCARIR
jgi:acetoin utilization protein AcuB